MTKKIKKMVLATIGAAFGLTSLQASAAPHPDAKLPSKMCFHIDLGANVSNSNLTDPEGTYLELGFTYEKPVKLDDSYRLRLVRAHGIGIGRTPILTGTLPVEWGEWAGSPTTGTCHKHGDQFQCSLESTSSITTQLPARVSPLAWSTETVAGSTSLVHDMTNNKTIMSLTGIGHAIFYNDAGERIPDAQASAALGIPTSREISTIIHSPDVEAVDCKSVPHPEIPEFFVPGI